VNPNLRLAGNQRFIRRLAALLLCCLVTPSFGMDGADFGEVQRIMLLPLEKQAQLADGILKKKYETSSDPASYENYMGYAIPLYALASDATFAAYRIAAVKPGLLSRFEVYDRCEEGRPKNLLECFLKQGRAGDYTDLGASCPACYGEAVTLFLWDEIGTPAGQMIGGLRFLYDPSLREGPPL
jgi:hypothetical protein